MGVSIHAITLACSGVSSLLALGAFLRTTMGESKAKTEAATKLLDRVVRLEQWKDTAKADMALMRDQLAQIPVLSVQITALDRLIQSRLNDVSGSLEHTIGQLERILEGQRPTSH